MFVYGTTDTSYVDTVSSTVEITKLHVNEQSKTRQVNTEGLMSANIADAMGIGYTNDASMSLILGDELAGYDIAILSDKEKAELEEMYSDLSSLGEANLGEYEVLDMTSDAETEDTYELVTKEPLNSYKEPSDKGDILNEYQRNTKVKLTGVEKDGYILVDNGTFNEWIKRDLLCTQQEYTKSLQGYALLEIDNPDVYYNGGAIKITGAERELLERLVMGEAGCEGYEGACLVAQTIRDFMLYKGYTTVESVRTSCKYSGSLKREPNKNVKDAVAFIFDEGGYAVRHKIFYFYAFKNTKSSWHETNPFVIQHRGHRFFDSK